MDEFKNGARYVRDTILAMLIGLQNKTGYSKQDDLEIITYQRVYNLIVERYGDMFENFKG